MLSPRKIYGRSSADAATALVEVKIDSSESVSALAEALVAKLHLGVAPNRVVLTVVDEGGAIVKVLNDPKATLDTSGVTSGATVVVSVLPPAASPSTEAGASSSPVVHPWSSGTPACARLPLASYCVTHLALLPAVPLTTPRVPVRALRSDAHDQVRGQAWRIGVCNLCIAR